MSTYGFPSTVSIGDLANVYSNSTSFITKLAVGDGSVASINGGTPAGGGQVAMFIGKGSNNNNGFFLSFNHYTDQNAVNYFRIAGYGHQTDAVGLSVQSQGNVGIGTTNPGSLLTVQNATASTGQTYLAQFSNVSSGICYIVDPGSTKQVSIGWNAGSSVIYTGRSVTAGRSISAAGTINASGADYAEYMFKSGNFTINKGDIIGINSNGLLTNIFSESITFVVKTTNPSYVGGDSWGTEENIGLKKPEPVNEDDPKYSDYQTDLNNFNTKYEAARMMVDRIAFSGQVPVNVLGATPGQYIIPMANEDGYIAGQAVSNPTIEQYISSVGKVIKVLPDGRSYIIVKVA
jgi:hypothetical protein